MNSTKNNIERKAAGWAVAATLLFAALIVGVLYLFGLYRLTPPPPEYGMEVNLGYMDEGSGDMQAYDPAAEPAQAQQEQEVAQEEEVVTAQDEAPAIAKQTVKPKPQKKKDVVKEKPKEKAETREPEEPKINPMALYPGKRKGTENSSQGETSTPGDQGKPTGDANASGYSGSGGSGGISFSLNGRTLMSLKKPEYNSDEEGIVVVRIWVNKNGEVTRVSAGMKGTTTMDVNLLKAAERAALGSKFVAKDNAPDEQTGTITYRFVRGV